MIPKFRAWLIERKEMRNVDFINFNEKDGEHEMAASPFVRLEGWCDYHAWYEIELMQGWKPEYQPELTIYKSDIINVHWFYAKHDPETLGVYEDEVYLESLEVLEENGILGFYFEDDFMPLGFVPAHEESFEVIGNVYQNPELIKNET